jgi:Protein of unknown function (DUF2550)
VTAVETIGLVVLILGALASIAFAWLLVAFHQRRVLHASGGLPVAMRRGSSRWGIGVGRYAADEFLWYRTWTLSPTATLRMPRSELIVVGTRQADSVIDSALRPGSMAVECRFRGEYLTLGFSDGALTGFLSWLEASAPRF